MNKIETRLNELEAERQQLLALRDTKRANQKFRCGCGALHAIKDCAALSHKFYTPPSGCTGGDYWSYSELHVICPVTDAKNRFMYESRYRTEYNLRNDFKHNAELQFNHMYLKLFKSVTDDYNTDKRGWWNNYYVDQNHKKFGIRLG
jgi:hypothetical protein